MPSQDNCNLQKNKTCTDKRTDCVRHLNDAFRNTLNDGQVLLTSGLLSLGPLAVSHILNAVRKFGDFSADNDPYGEHDFGSFSHAGHKVFWKIDYYDQALEFGSSDPADPLVTKRVLTIMLAAEY